MSRRTAEANKAVLEAWNREQKLVNEGKGTRDWNKQQQRDILDRGKAYDDNGKAFEGHHMMNAETYPEFQGNSDNIQFLSRQEHYDAHGGDFRNSTKGFYDYLTSETTIFDGNTFEPCKVIVLSDPVMDVRITIQKEMQDDAPNNKTDVQDNHLTEASKSGTYSNPRTKKYSPNVAKPVSKGVKVSETGSIKKVVKKVVDFCVDNKETIVGLAVAATEAAIAIGNAKGGSRRKSGTKKKTSVIKSDDVGKAIQKVSEVVEDVSKAKRSSPIEHTVSGYIRHMNGKEIHVHSYPRGGK